MEPVVELQNVSYSYHRPDREIRSLHHLSFSVLPGEFVAIVGPSGCGKSTLLSLICGLLQPEEGEVIIRARRTGFMPQKDHLLEWRSIFRNAILGPEMQHHNTLEVQEAVRNMLSAYGLDSFQNARPSELSGGCLLYTSHNFDLIARPLPLRISSVTTTTLSSSSEVAPQFCTVSRYLLASQPAG